MRTRACNSDVPRPRRRPNGGLAEYRLSLGITQEEVAEALSIPRPALSFAESGTVPASPAFRRRFKSACDRLASKSTDPQCPPPAGAPLQK